MKRFNLTILLYSFITLSVNAQVEVDKSIQFNSPYDSLRNIYNVGLPTDVTSGVSIKTSFENNLTYSESSILSANNFNLTTKVTVESIIAGTQLQFKVPQANTGSVILSINNQGSYQLLKFGNQVLAANDLKENMMADIIFDGANFQILTLNNTKSCPSGYVSVNNDFCIQEAVNSPLNWFDAAKQCMDNGGRLCKWSEFNLACEVLNTGSNDFTNQWEWVSATGDHHSGARRVGYLDCQSAESNQTINDSNNYRCCYDK